MTQERLLICCRDSLGDLMKLLTALWLSFLLSPDKLSRKGSFGSPASIIICIPRLKRYEIDMDSIQWSYRKILLFAALMELR